MGSQGNEALTDMQPHELDKIWLLERRPESAQDDWEKFSMKVADLMCDLFLPEDKARESAFSMYFGDE